MPAPAKRIWEYRDYWIDRVAGSDYLYAHWWDGRARRTRRRSLDTKILAEAKERLIALAGSVHVRSDRSPDSVLLVGALDFYYENNVKHKPSAKPAFRAIQIVTQFAAEKLGSAARVSAFSVLRQRDFMRWCVEKHDHSAGTIARNLAVVSAAFKFGCRVQIVRDGFGKEEDVLLLDSAPSVYTQSKDVAELTALPDSQPRNWLPTLEQLGHFIDTIDVRQENLFRFVILALNTYAYDEDRLIDACARARRAL